MKERDEKLKLDPDTDFEDETDMVNDGAKSNSAESINPVSKSIPSLKKKRSRMESSPTCLESSSSSTLRRSKRIARQSSSK